MRQTVLDALLDARSDGTARISPATCAQLADRIVEALARPNDTLTAVPAVVPAGAVVDLLSPADMVASLARSAATLADTEQRHAGVPLDATGDGPQAIESVTFPGHGQPARRLAWSLQSLFGVHVIHFASNDTFGGAGRPADLHAFRLVLDSLVAAAAPNAPAAFDEAEQFWTTVGELVTSSDKAKTMRNDAKARHKAARAAVESRWPVTIVPKLDAADNGTDLYRKAAEAVAGVAI